MGKHRNARRRPWISKPCRPLRARVTPGRLDFDRCARHSPKSCRRPNFCLPYPRDLAMTKSVQTAASLATAAVRIGPAAAFVLVLPFGFSIGASAQCVGSYHSGSGAGSHGSAASSGGVHSASGATHSSSCATKGTAANAARLAAFHPVGAGASGRPPVVTGYRTELRTAAAAHVNGKKVAGAAVKP